MGDIVHTLPAVATLRHNYPGARITWLVEPRWAALLEENPHIDRVAWLRRHSAAGLLQSWRELRSEPYDLAADFQGLIKSALAAAAARPGRIFGFDAALLRERAATVFYSRQVMSGAAHVVERNIDLALAASGGAGEAVREFHLPAGKAEGELPEGDFVLASPLAGWRSKQWPLEYYAALASRLGRELGVPLVLNGPPGAEMPAAQNIRPHFSGIAGLIHATRRATAVVGVDSGPLHLAAALAKPGVAIFGPTDPERNGPYGGSPQVLRDEGAITSYKRRPEIDPSMRRIVPDDVFEALRAALERRPER
jgi:heptosyltransferase-1